MHAFLLFLVIVLVYLGAFCVLFGMPKVQRIGVWCLAAATVLIILS